MPPFAAAQAGQTKEKVMPSEDETDANPSRSTIEEAADVLATSLRAGFDDVLRAAKAYASDHQDAAARQVSDYAAAAEEAAKVLKARDNAVGARLLGDAAVQMNDASGKIADASAERVAEGLEATARRNPAVFAAGSVLAGVALGYLIKSVTAEREAKTAVRAKAVRPAPRALPPAGDKGKTQQ